MTVSRFNPHRYPMLVSLGFFLITASVAFFHHTYWTIFDQDGLIYLIGGKQILNGDASNVQFVNAGPAGPVLFAVLDSVFNDGFFAIKLISLFSGTGIVFFSYYIIRNIFNARIALVGQLFVAFNPWFSIFSTQALNDLLSIFLVVFSLFFLTKENWKFYDLMIVGCLSGLGFMIRYQSILILFTAIVIVSLSQRKLSIKISYIAVLIGVFLILASPMFIFNYINYGNFLDSDSNYYIAAHSKYTTNEWQDQIFSNIGKDTIKGIFLDFDITLKNYFYNLFYGLPNNLFGFENRVNVSLIPAIYIAGIFPVLGGFLYSLRIKFDKTNVNVMVGSSSIIGILVITLGKFNDHFFAIVMIPIFILFVVNVKKIKKNLMPLIILPIVFVIVMSILPLRAPQHFLTIWISVAIFSAIFFVEVVPNIYKLIRKSNSRDLSSTPLLVGKISIVLVILILSINLGYSYLLYGVISSGNNPSFSSSEVFDYYDKKIQYDNEIRDITNILKNQPNIANSYVMSSHGLYSYYANSKWLGGLFLEGPENDTIENYITRKNWKEWQIFFSIINSNPMNRNNLINPVPDYLVYVPHEHNLDYLKVLSDPANPKIPSNFEVLYKSSRGTILYKIHHNEIIHSQS
jgi:4-amino-4-deoxy-L-arabinose transferase-like glycosyltransferase